MDHYSERRYQPERFGGYKPNYTNERHPRSIEESLLPNEMRISSMGNFDRYFENACFKIESGFEHFKIVGRGRAVTLTEEVVAKLKLRFRNY